MGFIVKRVPRRGSEKGLARRYLERPLGESRTPNLVNGEEEIRHLT